MSDAKSDQEERSATDVFQVPAQTAPTWEVELLISAASLFSLLLLPPLIDEATAKALAYLGDQLRQFVNLASLYTKVIVYGLILTFSAHLVLRAAWVSTLGLRSVYPDGIRWNKLRTGPIYRAHAQRHNISLEATVERVDNAASVVFACGTLMAIFSAVIMLLSLVFALIDAALSRFYFGGPTSTWVSLGLLLILMIPIVLPNLVDRWWGARLKPNGFIAQCLQHSYRLQSFFGASKIIHPIWLTISSQIGPRRFNLLSGLVLYTLMGVVWVEQLVREDRVDLGQSHVLLAQSSRFELYSAHYGSTRDSDQRYQKLPYIPDPVVVGDYLRLLVPFNATALRASLAKLCPQLSEPAAEASDAAITTYSAELLACVAVVYQLRVDGLEVAAGFDIATDPASGMRGFASFVDVRRLGPGRHILTLTQPTDKTAEDEPALWHIPFYR